MRNLKEEKTAVDEELSLLSIEDLRRELAESEMKFRAISDQKRELVNGFSSLLKTVKTRTSKILEVLEAKDSETSRKVLVEVSRK